MPLMVIVAASDDSMALLAYTVGSAGRTLATVSKAAVDHVPHTVNLACSAPMFAGARCVKLYTSVEIVEASALVGVMGC